MGLIRWIRWRFFGGRRGVDQLRKPATCPWSLTGDGSFRCVLVDGHSGLHRVLFGDDENVLNWEVRDETEFQASGWRFLRNDGAVWTSNGPERLYKWDNSSDPIDRIEALLPPEGT